jgi:ATP-dependent DNA ligase
LGVIPGASTREAVVLDKDGVSDFDALASYAFDILAADGEDLRRQALLLRKANLARLLSWPVDGILIADCEQGDGESCPFIEQVKSRPISSAGGG